MNLSGKIWVTVWVVFAIIGQICSENCEQRAELEGLKDLQLAQNKACMKLGPRKEGLRGIKADGEY